MRVYDVIIQDEAGGELSRSSFEAADDAAARDLVAHYYADQRCELRHQGQLIERLSPVIGDATA